jgi:zeta-carotene desaturase
VQLRFDGWVTELNDAENRQQLQQAAGIDNLLYTPDADFSCFADLALTSPGDYYKPGEGSLLQLVLTPGDPFIKEKNEDIAHHILEQVHKLFPSSRELNMTWYSVVKLAESLYREAPGMDPYRPPQQTPINNFFLAGSYTQQDYIDSMEGATLSGKQAAKAILAYVEQLKAVVV